MRVILSGGGTGGHIYPALALAEVIKQHEPEAEFLYVGSERGVESHIVPATGMDFEQLTVQGFKRSLSLDNIKTVNLFLKAVRQSKKIIKDFKPDVVVGTGGYVAGAVVYAAQRMHIPTVIHEQNSVAGVTNKFLARGATKIGVAFDVAKQQFPAGKATLVGNPRAQQVAHIKSTFSWQSLGLRDDKATLLIFGGSQGAPAINLAVIDAINDFNLRQYQVVIVTGPKRYDNVLNKLSEQKIAAADNVRIIPYIDNMPEVLAKTDAIVSRAGATSIAEITALGIPSILVPSLHVTGNHQTKNAQSLVDDGAALLLTETELTGKSLVNAADKLLLNEIISDNMAAQVVKVGMTDAGDRLYHLIQDAILEKKD
ncbi:MULTISPECIES: undecaprenyldiphospho-muramoylpentapeptide beta-N-acetylglucosaminyltransferase [Leuconostoc]|uniref:UDP-N-acetylglucosamine--N-acetylmuramyl-(pentapeptide) pyrophosphoryl-undecaprenol N-acetylglucosamine transferase n=2 Tax=Leuconostoc kimchii TaxID=136609 RepID=D5T167_LEUKI|nr:MULTISPECIES: undecaprenyldiphospho-muramoylpentapeptide beta-N-acetylglucosaminyltransferase [Leuconostoc]ADG40016.1 N-acetylglucosaminyl transferase [Leuconostoc kimchii IMSNU 11154]AEJ30186.1 undecaprenyldiphospho-muramoylpentapeptide beta-N- acetylglucosaminyltransferase [Leuconostoc sp. C2]QBR47273.1 undecaprenyldiphospho-muramoylpentapeptide beta-N-acetylglucosaminyltransferase [Leuconostoc kimchii]